MNKPASMVYEEFKIELANLINNCELPPFIIEPVLRNYLNEINGMVKRQYQIDKTQYENSLSDGQKEQKKKKEVKKEQD